MVNFPNAKINIGLNIIEKRSDGFHNIESCFYPVPCCDVLEILEAKEVSFKSTGLAIPGNNNDNLCLKAFYLLKADFAIPNYSIHLHKAIPIGAGLGGGSADAAFILKLINEKASLNLSESQLEHYARKLGSDCAFFIQNKPKYCFGKGDEFEGIQLDLTGKYLVLVNPQIHISTAEAYGGIKPKKPNTNLKEALNLPIGDWKKVIKNDFEISLFPKYPVLEKIKHEFYNLGAIYASMTGSGSTVYGLFETEIDSNSFDNNWVFSVKL